MLATQRKFWQGLRWFEKIMVLSTLVPGVKMFACYLDTLIFVVKLMALK